MLARNDATECYQAIGNALANASEGPWDRIVVDAALDGVRIDAIVACWMDAAPEPHSFLTGVPRLASFIYDLARLVSTQEKGLFKSCRFVLYRQGKFDVQFAY